MIDFTFHTDDQILYITYKETIRLEDFPPFFDDLSKLHKENVFPEVLMIISDYTQAQIAMQPKDIPQLFAWMQGYFGAFRNIYEAFIHVNPFETALSVIAKEQAAHQSTYVSEVFSSVDSAKAWLQKH